MGYSTRRDDSIIVKARQTVWGCYSSWQKMKTAGNFSTLLPLRVATLFAFPFILGNQDSSHPKQGQIFSVKSASTAESGAKRDSRLHLDIISIREVGHYTCKLQSLHRFPLFVYLSIPNTERIQAGFPSSSTDLSLSNHLLHLRHLFHLYLHPHHHLNEQHY